MDGFKTGKFRVLVATDIAARGIDVKDIEVVINYDLPDEAGNYVHRIGRTGRAGKSGHAITFATPDQGAEVKAIERFMHAPIPISQHPDLPAEPLFGVPKPGAHKKTLQPIGARPAAPVQVQEEIGQAAGLEIDLRHPAVPLLFLCCSVDGPGNKSPTIPTQGRMRRMFSQKAKSGFATTLKEIKEAGLFKDERIILTPQGADIRVKDGEVINFCANNYLGLSNHPRLVAAAKEALDRYGYGMSSVRFICGTQDIHKELEREIADFLGTDDTILYSSCFDANGGLFETLLGRRVRDHLRRAQPRLDHRRHPAVQGRAQALRARRHGRSRGPAQGDPERQASG